MQLRAEYRPEAALSEKKAQLEKAIAVTKRQYDLIRQKTDALNEMRSHLEERLSTFDGWMKALEEQAKAERKGKAKAKV
jgi:hypothetical protein